MKIQITMKDPDGFYEAIESAVEESMGERPPAPEDDNAAVRKTLRDVCRACSGVVRVPGVSDGRGRHGGEDLHGGARLSLLTRCQ